MFQCPELLTAASDSTFSEGDDGDGKILNSSQSPDRLRWVVRERIPFVRFGCCHGSRRAPWEVCSLPDPQLPPKPPNQDLDWRVRGCRESFERQPPPPPPPQPPLPPTQFHFTSTARPFSTDHAILSPAQLPSEPSICSPRPAAPIKIPPRAAAALDTDTPMMMLPATKPRAAQASCRQRKSRLLIGPSMQPADLVPETIWSSGMAPWSAAPPSGWGISGWKILGSLDFSATLSHSPPAHHDLEPGQVSPAGFVP